MDAITEDTYKKRRNKIINQIKGEAALFASSLPKNINKDLFYPYVQDNNLFYLTGILEEDSALLLLGKKEIKSVLFVKEKNPEMEKWLGETIGVKKAKKIFKVDEVFSFDDIESHLTILLKDTSTLHFFLGINKKIDDIVLNLLKTNYTNLLYPTTLKNSSLLTSKLRHIKDKKEISFLKKASKVTALSIKNLLKNFNPSKTELQLSKELEESFFSFGATSLAFPTIVASGPSSTTLHHMPQNKKLPKEGLILIDAGASYNGYSADISRTFPISGKFSEIEGKVYDIVLLAVNNCIKMAKPGVTMDKLHHEALKTITKGLVSLGVLNGKVSKLIKEKAYLPFYMHRTGHFVGLDVHDISPVYFKNNKTISSYKMPLQEANVITIEPGLYFDPKDKKISKELRGIGIRIEEDILITRTSNQVISNLIPRDRKEIENLIKKG